MLRAGSTPRLRTRNLGAYLGEAGISSLESRASGVERLSTILKAQGPQEVLALAAARARVKDGPYTVFNQGPEQRLKIQVYGPLQLPYLQAYHHAKKAYLHSPNHSLWYTSRFVSIKPYSKSYLTCPAICANPGCEAALFLPLRAGAPEHRKELGTGPEGPFRRIPCEGSKGHWVAGPSLTVTQPYV